jgi:hypothetical protein
MKTDVITCSTCPGGQEWHKTFWSKIVGRELVQGGRHTVLNRRPDPGIGSGAAGQVAPGKERIMTTHRANEILAERLTWGHRVRHLRHVTGWTQAELAERVPAGSPERVQGAGVRPRL